uniref:type II secretion system protein GspL n=1 Tax=Pseudomonas rhodesiae TaxID=76760 RepID=UPI0028B001BC
QPSGAGWGRALACVALAVALWTLGLNLYAARQADAGQRLKTQMSQQVRQAFPELPVVLNPLQQARQQLAARQGGTDTGPRFSALLQLVGNHLPFMVGSVEQLTFEQGRLHLALLAGSRQPAQPEDWQAALAQAGFAATRDEQGWSIGPAQPVENAEASDE